MDRLQGGLARIFGKSTDQQRFDTHIVKNLDLQEFFGESTNQQHFAPYGYTTRRPRKDYLANQ